MKRGNIGENPIHMDGFRMKYRVDDRLIEKIGRSNFFKIENVGYGGV